MINRFCLLALVLCFTVLNGCTPKETGNAESASNAGSATSGLGKPGGNVSKVDLLLNWYPEAEHGGFYAALVHGYYNEAGVDVRIVPGAKGVVVGPELALGRSQFGVGNADDVLMARAQELNLKALMAPMQIGPRSIMVRADSGIDKFEQLKNVTLQIDPSRPYVPFLKSKNLLDSSVQLVPYNGTVSQLVAGPGFAQQAYVFSEPLMAEQQGVPVRNLMMSDIGYNPYASLLLASDEYIAANSDVVKRVTQASIRGWKKYLEDPAETNAYILKQNPDGMTAESLTYGAEKLRALCMPEGVSPDDFGKMSEARWKELHSQLSELKLLEGKPVDPMNCFTNEFIQAAKDKEGSSAK
jgi:NitT/TauT family transport system substrate-binding protein